MSKRKEKNRHSFWKRMHFKYRLSILNENTLEEVWKLRVSMFNGIALYFSSLLLLMIISSVIIISTPLRNYLPGYLDSEIREQSIQTSMKVDSLEMSQYYQDAYLQNIKDIFAGKVQPESVSKTDTVRISEDDKSLKSTDKEKKFKEEYEQSEKYNLSSMSITEDVPAEGVTFFKPIKGLLTKRFSSQSKQYGVQINPASESIVATLEGTVVFAGYDPEAGYIIQIQHKNGFVSVYKGASLLLKKIGDKIRTGEAIAIVKNEGEGKQTNNTIDFELWYKGNAVNPEIYISF